MTIGTWAQSAWGVWEEPRARTRGLPGRPVSNVLYKPDWYQKDGGSVVLCVIHTQFHPFEVWDFVWWDELPPTNLLAPNGNTFPSLPKL